MNFEHNENQGMIAQMVRDFAEKEIKPNMKNWDDHEIFPEETMKKLGELGLLGIFIPEEYGGSGFGYAEYATALMELGKVCGGIGLSVAAHNSLCTGHIFYHGSEAQKKKYLPKLASGEWIGAWGLTEANTGSDAMRMKTTAVKDGDHWILNGTKNWITNGGTSKIHLVIAQTDREKGHRGINAFIVETDWDGVGIGAKEDKLGIRSSDTHTIMYTDVKVPKENRIGEDGFGFKFAMRVLTGGRIGIASQAVGIAAGAYELAVAYSHDRAAFGKPINQHQAIAFKLADMATEIDAARMMVHRAAWMKDEKMDYTMSAAMAKVFASEVAMKHTVEAVQIHGGYGFVKEYHVERLMRDAKITQIYEGTSEIQRVVISREIIKKGNLYAPILGAAVKV